MADLTPISLRRIVAENSHRGFIRPVPTLPVLESRTFGIGTEHASSEVGDSGGGTMKTQLKWILSLLLVLGTALILTRPVSAAGRFRGGFFFGPGIGPW